jgi:ribonuclease J
VLIDAGLMFPDEEMLGVDLIIPDVGYVRERLNKLRGILITHGHEDHVGALPYMLPALRLPNGKLPPVYCTQLTRGLISLKLDEHHLLNEADLRLVRPGSVVKLGRLSAEWVHITHSIPDATSIALTTPFGVVLHSGDFKFDHTPVMGAPPDLTRLAELGRQGSSSPTLPTRTGQATRPRSWSFRRCWTARWRLPRDASSWPRSPH